MSHEHAALKNAPLGQKSTYATTYQPDLLCPITRKNNRLDIGVTGALPFQGKDIWNAFELSWLNMKGKPVVAVAEIVLPCESPNLVESKSIKLYLNSLNNTKFESFTVVRDTLVRDLSKAADVPVEVALIPLKQTSILKAQQFSGICLDDLDISCDTYHTEPAFLTTENTIVTETVFSDLLKSNCLVTEQPDWGSVQITYTGKKIQHAGLLKYIVSFRNHNEFHEHCVERIFMDIMKQCAPEKLLVYGRYTRRGGLDINPYRANYTVTVDNLPLCRQ